MAQTTLEDNKSVRCADIYKAGVLAGTIHRSAPGLIFRYLDAYLETGGTPIATTLPLTDEPVHTMAGAVPPFFAGLLPEGRRLVGLRRAVKTSADDELSLLLAVGRDTIGDVQVLPQGTIPTRPEPLVRVVSDWNEVRFVDLLTEAGLVDPVALPGVQEKVSAAMITMPVGTPGEPAILKLDPPEFPHLIANEAYFLAQARAAGLPTTEAEVVTDSDGRQGLLVRRFDRLVQPDGSSRALACEDACQLLSKWPADKYGVGAEEAAVAVAAACPARIVALRLIFQQFAFAWLTGNGDLHLKNLAVLATEDGEWRPAPAFDVPCSAVYGDTTFALTLDGQRDGLSRRRWLAFAASIGLPARAAVRVLDGLLDALEDLPAAIRSGALPFAQRQTADLHATLRDRRRLMSGDRH